MGHNLASSAELGKAGQLCQVSEGALHFIGCAGPLQVCSALMGTLCCHPSSNLSSQEQLARDMPIESEGVNAHGPRLQRSKATLWSLGPANLMGSGHVWAAR